MSSYIKFLSAYILIRKYGAKKPQVMLNFFPCVYNKCIVKEIEKKQDYNLIRSFSGVALKYINKCD